MGPILKNIAKFLKAVLVGFKDIFPLIGAILKVNLRLYKLAGKGIAGVYNQIFKRWRGFLMAAFLIIASGIITIGLGLHHHSGLVVAIGGFIHLFFFASTLGFVEGTARIIAVIIKAAEKNLEFYRKILSGVAKATLDTDAFEKELFNFKELSDVLERVKQVRLLILPFLAVIAFLIWIPHTWTAGLAFTILYVIFFLAYYANTFGYDTSKARKRFYLLAGLLVPAIIVTAIVPESREATGDKITDLRSYLGGDGLDNNDDKTEIVFVTPTRIIVARDTTGKATSDTLRPGFKMAFCGITEKQFRLGELPKLKDAPNGFQKLIEYYEAEVDDYVKPVGTVLAAKNFELWSEYEKRQKDKAPSTPDTKSVVTTSTPETAQLVSAPTIGSSWHNTGVVARSGEKIKLTPGDGLIAKIGRVEIPVNPIDVNGQKVGLVYLSTSNPLSQTWKFRSTSGARNIKIERVKI